MKWFRWYAVPRMKRWGERCLMFLAWHVVPRELRKCVVVRAFADATTCDEGRNDTPDTVGYSKVMDRAFPRVR